MSIQSWLDDLTCSLDFGVLVRSKEIRITISVRAPWGGNTNMKYRKPTIKSIEQHPYKKLAGEMHIHWLMSDWQRKEWRC